MTPINPSPIPWSYDDCRPNYEGDSMVFDADGKPVAYFGNMEDNTWEEISNARYIVQCVNSHAVLLEACRDAARDLTHVPGTRALVARLQTAIAKAEEVPPL